MNTHSRQADLEGGPAPARGDHGSVLAALEGLTIDVVPDDSPEERPTSPSPAFLPARRPRVEPGTGIIDVRALGIRARRPEVVVAPAPRPAPSVVVSPALMAERPVAPPVRTPPPSVATTPRLSPVAAFLVGALVGTGVFAASLLLLAAT